MAGILLEDYKEDEECPGRVAIKQDDATEEEWSVEEILGKKKVGGVWKYHIKWYRWAHKFNTWEPASNLTHCKEKLAEFEKEWQAKNGSKKKSKEKSKRAPEVAGTSQDGEQLALEQDGEYQAKTADELNQEVKDFDMMWLGDHYSMFRRKWRSNEEPICVEGSTVYNSVLLHMVRVRVKSLKEIFGGTYKAGKWVEEENTVIVLSTMFRKIFPQVLIAYYESRVMLMEGFKSKENLLKDAARAGLMHNLMGAKVNANYGKMFKDMMPATSGQDDQSTAEDKYDYFPKVNPKDEVKQKKKVEYKMTPDRFGLPYYYGDEAEGTFGTSEEESQSDDSDEWEEVGEGGIQWN